MRVAISRGARTRTSRQRSAIFAARTRATSTLPMIAPSVSSTVTTSPALMDFAVNSCGMVTMGFAGSLRASTSVTARPGQMATHFSHASHCSPTNSGRPHEIVTLDPDSVVRADRRAGVARDLLGAVKYRKRAARIRRDVFGHRRARPGLQHLRDAMPFRRDLAHVAAERACDLQPADSAREHRRRRFSNLLRVPRGVDGEPELLRLVHELIDGIQADGDEHRIAPECLLGSREPVSTCRRPWRW